MTFSLPPTRLPPMPGWTERPRAAVGDAWRAIEPPLALFWRVTHALVLREARVRFGARSAGYAWALLTPTMQLVMLLAVFVILGRQSPAGDSIIVFFMTGLLPFFTWRHVLVRGASAIRSNIGLMAYPQVRPLEIITARTILELVTMVIIGLCFVVVCAAFFDTPVSAWADDPVGLLTAFLVFVVFCFGTATFSAQMGRVFTLWSEFMTVAARVMWFTTGVFFTMKSVPEQVRQFVALNPMAHVIEWIRDVAIAGYQSDVYDPFYPLIAGVVLLFIGLLMDWLIGISSYADD